MMQLNIEWIYKDALLIFAVINVLGGIPILLDLKKKGVTMQASRVAFSGLLILLAFMFIGPQLLQAFDLTASEFRIAGAFIILVFGIELLIDRSIFYTDPTQAKEGSVTPVAFPIFSGPGTMTTVVAMREAHGWLNVSISVMLNLLVIYMVVRYLARIHAILGGLGISLIRKVIGLILFSLALQAIKNYFNS